MADGALMINLDGPLKERVEKAARAVGATVDAFVAQALDFAVDPDTDWMIDQAIASETIAGGDGIPLDQFIGWNGSANRPNETRHRLGSGGRRCRST